VVQITKQEKIFGLKQKKRSVRSTGPWMGRTGPKKMGQGFGSSRLDLDRPMNQEAQI